MTCHKRLVGTALALVGLMLSTLVVTGMASAAPLPPEIGTPCVLEGEGPGPICQDDGVSGPDENPGSGPCIGPIHGGPCEAPGDAFDPVDRLDPVDPVDPVDPEGPGETGRFATKGKIKIYNRSKRDKTKTVVLIVRDPDRNRVMKEQITVSVPARSVAKLDPANYIELDDLDEPGRYRYVIRNVKENGKVGRVNTKGRFLVIER